MWPVLLESHQRVPWWKIPLIWVSDLVSLAVFARAFVVHGCLARPLRNVPLQQAGWGERWPALALLVAWCLDLGLTVGAGWDEQHARRTNARVTVGQIVSCYHIPYLAERGRPAGRSYHFIYQYRDEAGRLYQASSSTSIDDNGRSPHSLPQETVQGLLEKRSPLLLRVEYDADWPGRSWPADIPSLVNAQAYVFSAAFLAAQFVVFAGFVAGYISTVRRGFIPWWRVLMEASPSTAQAAMLFLIAVVRYIGFVPYHGN
jgi:hypothetical protein